MKKIKTRRSKEKPVIHEQWIEVQLLDGESVTTFFPPNEEFETERLEMDPQPTLIYRRFNFVHGVPTEYDWTLPTPAVKKRGGLFLQRMSLADWINVLAAERLNNHTQVVSAEHPLARPEAFGPCPCPDCRAQREQQAA